MSVGTGYGRFAAMVNSLLITIALCFSPAHAQNAPDKGTTPVKLAFLGDSLAAGYGLKPDQAIPARLEAALRAAGRNVTVINHGVSGDTTAGGLARVDWMLADKPDIVIVELGGNDALRALDPAVTERNLDAIIGKLKQAGVTVWLAGMLAPPNLGADYGREFNALYPALAEKHRVPLYPFFLDGVAAEPSLNQPDGMHPNAKGVAVIVERLAPHVIRALNGE